MEEERGRRGEERGKKEREKGEREKEEREEGSRSREGQILLQYKGWCRSRALVSW